MSTGKKEAFSSPNSLLPFSIFSLLLSAAATRNEQDAV
jgi:hypothetical protein